MRARRTPILALALWAAAWPAAAQDDEPSRADAARAAREAKATTLHPYRPGRIERLLDLVETDGTIRRLLAPGEGWSLRLGGIEGGSALALGPGFRTRLRDGLIQADTAASAALSGDRAAAASLTLPHLGTHRLRAQAGIAATHLAGERFFGLGADSLHAHQSAYRIERHQVGAGVTFDAASWLQVSGGASLLQVSAGNGRRRGLPAIGDRFVPGDVPGLSSRSTLRVLEAAATVDTRDRPGNPRAGGRYHLGVERYQPTARDHAAFTRIDAVAEHHVSGWRRQRTLTLRALSSSTLGGEDGGVPFYLLPSLGGRTLRGYATDRFRDRQLVALQAEYGVDLLPFVTAVAFYEAGMVAPRWRDLSLHDLQRDYGIGARFGGARAVTLRTDVAFGGADGTRFSMGVNHAF